MHAKTKTSNPTTPKPATEEKRRVRILVSSVVYGYQDFLESIYALLESYGYEVLMSHKGTIPINPNISAMSSCEDAVDDCHVFLGIILPSYGSGREEGNPHSITHREAIRAIEKNKPRWFLVHEHVAIARQLLNPFRETVEIEPAKYEEFEPGKFKEVKPAKLKGVEPWTLKPGHEFQKTPILSDLRVLDLYDLAMRHDIPKVKDRKGNWVQSYGEEDDARLFVTTQFRRYREVMEQYLPRIKDPVVTSGKGGQQ